MRVRIVNHAGDLLAVGDLIRVWRYGQPMGSRFEVIRVLPGGAYRSGWEEPPWGAAHVRLDAKHDMPLWYGGTYREDHLDFSLPTGLHNVWGQGNFFDTDAFRIHPDDVAHAIRMAEEGE